MSTEDPLKELTDETLVRLWQTAQSLACYPHIIRGDDGRHMLSTRSEETADAMDVGEDDLEGELVILAENLPLLIESARALNRLRCQFRNVAELGDDKEAMDRIRFGLDGGIPRCKHERELNDLKRVMDDACRDAGSTFEELKRLRKIEIDASLPDKEGGRWVLDRVTTETKAPWQSGGTTIQGADVIKEYHWVADPLD